MKNPRRMEMMMTPTTSNTLKTLEDYIDYQERFQERVIALKFPGKEVPEELTPVERNDMVIKMVLSAIGELIEFLEKATNYKVHKLDRPIDMEAAIEEFVDAQKYIWNIPVYMPEIRSKFKEMFIRKSIIVEERMNQEQQRLRESQIGGGA
jgi:hypothetical protein